MLPFLFGYWCYLGKILLHDINNGEPISIPDADPIIKAFPKILDNIDINEDIIKYLSTNSPPVTTKIVTYIESSKQTIKWVYPLIYCDQFQLNESDITKTASNDQALRDTRSQLITHDLIYHNPTAKTKTKKNDTFNTNLTYKPFTIRELDMGDYEFEDI